MKTLKIVMTMFLCGIFLFGAFQPAFATLGVWTVKLAWANFSGTSDAYGGKMVRKLSTVPAQWAADIVSYTDFPPATITLGWTYFSATEFCGGVAKQNKQGGALSAQGTEKASTIFMTTMSCSSTRYGRSAGKHEFKYGGQTVRSDWYQEDVIP